MRRPPKFIVSDEHRFVYGVVQKVACSSVKAALLPLFGADKRAATRTGSVHDWFAASPHEIRGEKFLAGLRAGHYGGHFKFAFVRNPWDRLVSCYLQKLGEGADPNNSVARRFARRRLPGPGFRAFAEFVCGILDERANPHFRSQHVGLVVDGGLFPDFVGRFERLAEDFVVVARELGIDPSEIIYLTQGNG